MAHYFKWDPVYFSVNVPDLDAEHQLLIEKMNGVYEAQAAGGDSAAIAAMLQDFAACAAKHFADEEAYMESVHYEGIEEHKQIHKHLLKQVSEYIAAFEKSGKVTNDFFRFFSLWLTSHIRGVDIKYSPKRR